jgi:hypothetical protein
MKATTIQLAAALTLTFGIAACVPSTSAPTPTPAPVTGTAPPAPSAGAPRQPVPMLTDWDNLPATPGQWRYSARNGASEAAFSGRDNQPLAQLSCDPARRAVSLTLPGASARGSEMIVQSETQSRVLPYPQAQGGATVTFAPGDPLLDAMALSKGRFAVNAVGAGPLILPSYAEVSRVIEDCR